MTGGSPGMEEAVPRMLCGDEDAFRVVYREVHPPLVRYLSVLVGPDEADDVASETWAQAFRDLSRFSGDADGFRGWVTTIGRHRALDHLRRRSRRPQVVQGLGEIAEPPHLDDVEGRVLAAASTEAVVELVRRLPRDQAEAVMLRAVLGFDAEIAARILGKRAGAVRVASHRGLRRLAAELGGQPAERISPATCNTFLPRGAEGVR